jgi:hypothetical protein
MTSSFIHFSFLFFSSALAFHQMEQSEFGVVHLYPPIHTEQHETNCTSDTAIIDKLLNGTGYNKFKIPSGRFFGRYFNNVQNF